jgi:hypothetical protein
MYKKTTKLMVALLLYAMAVMGQNTANITCVNNDPFNTTGNWETQAATISISTNQPDADGTPYLLVADRSSNQPSWVYNDTDFGGNFLSVPTCLCVDYKIFNDGHTNETRQIAPRIWIFNGDNPRSATLMAVYTHSVEINENSDWTRICTTIDTDTELANNGESGWQMRVGNDSQWDDLISNVSGIAFDVDVAGSQSQSERIGIDNLCFGPCVNCSPLNYFTYFFEDENQTFKEIFCLGEDVYLNGTLLDPNISSYFMDLHIVNDDSSLTYVADQYVTGWSSNPFDLINITDLFENDPDGAVVFQPNVRYELKVAINDPICGWLEQRKIFRFYEPFVAGHTEDENQNDKSVFCLGEDVYLNATDTQPWYGLSHFIDLHIVNPDGSLTYVADQDFDGWSSDPLDYRNITKIFENDPDGAVVFQPNVTYQIKLAIDDARCGWAETLINFSYHEPIVDAHLEDENGNIQSNFCIGDQVILDGMASSWIGNSFFVDLHIVNPDGSLMYVADQGVSGWEPGDPFVDIIKLFENDPDGAITFLTDTRYQVKFAIDDEHCGWQEVLLNFVLEECCDIAAPSNIQVVGNTVSWDPLPDAVSYIVSAATSWPQDCSCNQPVSIPQIQTINTSVTLPIGFENCTAIVIQAVCADNSTSPESDVVCVRGDFKTKAATTATISPNPNKGFMNIQIATDTNVKNISLQIHNFSGHLVQTFDQLQATKGIIDFNIDVRSKLPRGFYVFIFTVGDETISKQVIIE